MQPSHSKGVAVWRRAAMDAAGCALWILLLFHFAGRLDAAAGAGRPRFASLFGWLVRQWGAFSWSGNYWFCPLMPMTAGVFFLLGRRRWRGAPACPAPWWGASVCAAGLLLHGWGLLGTGPYISFLGLVVVLGGVVLGIWGRGMLDRALVPLVFLALSAPWDSWDDGVERRLQVLMAWLTQGGLRLLGVPVARVGTFLLGPGFALVVAASCSGLRAVTALGLLSLGVAGLANWPAWKRAVLVGVSVPFALLSNLVRLVALGLLCFVTGQRVVSGPWCPVSAWRCAPDFGGIEQFLGALILPIGAVWLLGAYELLCRGRPRAIGEAGNGTGCAGHG